MSAVQNILLSSTSWAIGAALVVGYIIYGAVYRLYLSPIAKFPGPKLAALTLWYEFYYDVILDGKYTWEIEKMHQKYGPIVRINPFELHINDPEYYDELYAGSAKRRDKYPWSVKMFGNSDSMLGTVPHDHHRIRRAALNPYFSKRTVAQLESLIQSVVENLCGRLSEFRKSGEPVNLNYAYAALTLDVITEYCFARSYGCLAEPNFAPKWLDIIMAVSRACHINQHFGWLFPLMNAMPESMVKVINPDMMQLINFQKALTVQIGEIMEGKNDDYKNAAHPTIFHELLNSDLSSEEKTLRRLVEEGQTVVAAGAVTTAHYLKFTSYHLLTNPDILQKLKAELETVMPNPNEPASLQKLEQLPYLSAVVSEGFRMSYGVIHRLQRVSPDAPLVFRNWVIPAGTPVGMTSLFIHDNPDLFPEPKQFRPDRWLNQTTKNESNGTRIGDNTDVKNHRLERYLVNFSKGSRTCLGINLAYAEIYLTLATIFRRFDLELYQTTRADIDIVYDWFNPMPRLDSKGVRVVVQ